MDQACKLLVVTEYHLWGAVDQRVLDDPQWWADVYLWFRLRASQQQPTVPEWAENASHQEWD